MYILTNTYNTVFYTGITSNILQRIYEHKNKLVKGFTSKYNVWKLIYFEEYNEVMIAIEREKQIKDYRRKKKFQLITSINPTLNEIVVD